MTILTGTAITLLGVLSFTQPGSHGNQCVRLQFPGLHRRPDGQYPPAIECVAFSTFCDLVLEKEEILEHTDTKEVSWGPLFIFVAKFIAPLAILVVLIMGMLNWLS
ncbi:MAG: hypothetical protein U5K84_06200 [Alkalibacterium sp.]|nr:hypothetical protein [Alkalibacterium sp.]